MKLLELVLKFSGDFKAFINRGLQVFYVESFKKT